MGKRTGGWKGGIRPFLLLAGDVCPRPEGELAQLTLEPISVERVGKRVGKSCEREGRGAGEKRRRAGSRGFQEQNICGVCSLRASCLFLSANVVSVGAFSNGDVLFATPFCERVSE